MVSLLFSSFFLFWWSLVWYDDLNGLKALPSNGTHANGEIRFSIDKLVNRFFDKLNEPNHYIVMLFFLFFFLLLIRMNSTCLSTLETAVSDPSCLPNQTPFQFQWKIMESDLNGFVSLCVKHGSCTTLEIPKQLGVTTSYACITKGTGSIIKLISNA